MHIEYAFLADAADASPTGKLYVLGGGIDELIVPQFPAVHGRLSAPGTSRKCVHGACLRA